MQTEKIISNIAKHIVLSAEQEAYFISLLEHQEVKRNEFILRENHPCNNINFVTSGLLRAYFISPNGKEHTIMFAKEDWWITDMYCFTTRKPAMVSIQAIEESIVLSLSRTKLDELYQKIPEFNKFFRILMENAYSREQLRTVQNLSFSAIDRYHDFVSKYPLVASKVPLKHIASYLGVTPEFLSTIRAKEK